MRKHLLIVLCFVMRAIAGDADRIRVGEDGWFYVDGERCYIKGVCFFENHSVEGRFERSSLEVLDAEFTRIKAAGFNAIRSQLRPDELTLAQRHGLLVLQGANHQCFSREYLDQDVVREQEEKTREIAAYSASHENILAYLIDNEPNVQDGIYRQGENAITGLYGRLSGIVRESRPDACVSIAGFPPAAFLDDSLFDAVFFNLYPWYPSPTPEGYADYLGWYKRRHAARKPLVISEYGWTYGQGERVMEESIADILDAQIAAGASGAFLFTWRTFGPERQDDNLWIGLMPNRGGAMDYTNAPRRVVEVLQAYFEAVVVEPVKNRAYSKILPVRVYGSDRTHTMTVHAGRQSIPLQKNGRYWWKADIPFPPGLSDRHDVIIEARDCDGRVLAKKEVNVWVNESRPVWTVDIVSETISPAPGDSYAGRITVVDQDNQPVGNARIHLLVNETGKDCFAGTPCFTNTDEKGTLHFEWPSLMPGYFTLMAGVGMSDEGRKVNADVETCRRSFEISFFVR